MIKLVRTDSQNPGFIYLVARLDAFLAELDGEEHAFYNSLNKIDTLKQVIVAYEDDKPVGCGAIRYRTGAHYRHIAYDETDAFFSSKPDGV